MKQSCFLGGGVTGLEPISTSSSSVTVTVDSFSHWFTDTEVLEGWVEPELFAPELPNKERSGLNKKRHHIYKILLIIIVFINFISLREDDNNEFLMFIILPAIIPPKK